MGIVTVCARYEQARLQVDDRYQWLRLRYRARGRRRRPFRPFSPLYMATLIPRRTQPGITVGSVK